MEDFFSKAHKGYSKVTMYSGTAPDESNPLMVMVVRDDGALCQKKMELRPEDCVARITLDGIIQ